MAKVRPLDQTVAYATHAEFAAVLSLAEEAIERRKADALAAAGGTFPIGSEEAAVIANGTSAVSEIRKWAGGGE